MSSLFLCHSHQDKPFVRRLANDLKRYHHTIWIDEAEIKIGDSLLQKIADAITKVDYVIAIISDDSKNSEWIKKELDIAMTREINEKRVVVLPIILTQKGLPNFLLGKLYADFSDESKYYKNLILLLKTITISPSFTEKQDIIKALNVKDFQRINLGLIDLVDIFNYLKTIIFENDIEHLLEEVILIEKNENGLWDKGVYEGYLSACICFLSFHHSIFLYEMEDASARVNVIAMVMGKYEGDIRNSARLNEEIVPQYIKRYNNYYEEWNSEGVEAGQEMRNILLKFCPTRETQKFYLGWHYFCSLLYRTSMIAIDHKLVINTNYYIGYTINQILKVAHTFEFDYNKVSFNFWYIVYIHILNTLGSKKINSIKNKIDISQFYEGNEEEFINALEKKLEISVELKNSWNKTLKKIGQHLQAAVIAWIDLRSKYKFFVNEYDKRLKIELTKKYS